MRGLDPPCDKSKSPKAGVQSSRSWASAGGNRGILAILVATCPSVTHWVEESQN